MIRPVHGIRSIVVLGAVCEIAKINMNVYARVYISCTDFLIFFDVAERESVGLVQHAIKFVWPYLS